MEVADETYNVVQNFKLSHPPECKADRPCICTCKVSKLDGNGERAKHWFGDLSIVKHGTGTMQ